LYASASRTSASSSGSPNVAIQSSATAPDDPPRATHAWGSVRLGSACALISSGLGGDWSAHADIAAAATIIERACARRIGRPVSAA
jgi:hypothetical protein